MKLALQDLAVHFSGNNNIAVVLGRRSGGLVDVDLDSVEAMALAPLYLPLTGAVFGRASKPASHWLYVAPGAMYRSFGDPFVEKDSPDKATLVELRADGKEGGAHLTILPPSIADGEVRRWESELIAPAIIDARVLQHRVMWLAIACLVFRYVSEHAARHPKPDLPRLLWEFDHHLARPAFAWLGRRTPDAPHRYPRPRHQHSARELELAEIVAGIPNDCDWHGWNAHGLAIYAASAGSDEGFYAFDDFSARNSKYDPHAVEERWQNYRRSPPSRTGIGKLAAEARRHGWRPNGRAAERSS